MGRHRRLRVRIKRSRKPYRPPKMKTRHHMCPRSRSGSSHRFNLLILDDESHKLLHKLFGNRTLVEIIETLIRVARAKHYEDEEPAVSRFYGVV